MAELHDLLERESERYALPEGAGERMFERGRRRERNRRLAALSVGVILFVAMLAIVRSGLPVGDREPRPAVPAPINPRSIAGTYSVRLGSEDPGVGGLLEGRFEMRLRADGAMDLTSPKRFDLPGDPITFEIHEGLLTTDALVGSGCDAPGAYRVGLDAGTLAFVPVDEPCELRRVLLATRAWTSVIGAETADRLEGDWTATFSCEQMVRAVRMAPAPEDQERFWTAAVSQELGSDDYTDPCQAASEPLGYTFRFSDGRLLIFDRDLVEGFDGSYELRGHVITFGDGAYDNLDGRYQARFEIEGDQLRFDLIGRGGSDAFFVATWESAPFVKRP